MKIAGISTETGEPITLTCEHGKITQLEQGVHPYALGGGDTWVSAGFCDLQVNGYGGYDFNIGAWGDSSEIKYDIPTLMRKIAASGTALLLPTLTTNSFENLSEALLRLAHYTLSDDKFAKCVTGIHLEGPYISKIEGPRGAHPLEHTRNPSWDEFRVLQEAARGKIKLLTLAPELEGSSAFIRKVVASGVVVAIGHTAAEPEEIREAILAGATLSTHLGNAAHGTIKRHPNYIWEQMAQDSLYASLITDGHHLPPAVVKSMVRAKGAERVALVSDAVALAGLPAGKYMQGRFQVLETGKIVLAGTPYLAGAGHLLDTCIPNAFAMSDLSLAQTIRSVTSIPARILGTEHKKGHLRVGYDADLTLFRLPTTVGHGLEIVATLCEGDVLYKEGD